MIFLLGCHPRNPKSPKVEGQGMSSDAKATSPTRLIDLLKPEFQTMLPSAYEVEWRTDTLDLGEGTCFLARKEPFFKTLRRPNTWLSEIYRTRLGTFVEVCEELAEDPQYGGIGNEGFFQADIARMDANLLSMSVEVSAQNPGGKFFTEVHSLNMKPNSGEEYTIYDLFAIPKDSVNRLLKRLVIPRTDNFVDYAETEERLFEGGVTPAEKVFSTFVLDGEELMIVLHGGNVLQWFGPPDYVGLELGMGVN